MKKLAFILFAFVLTFNAAYAQQNRFELLEKRLKDLAALSPGLNENVDFAVSGASIQEFLRGLAESHNLNISIDPQLNFKIYNNFTDEKVANVLLFLAKEYDLDIRFVGSIMSFHPYLPPLSERIAPPKELIVHLNSYNNLISFDLKNDTLAQVARKLTQVMKKNVILAPGISDRKITAYIENMEFDAAMEKLAFANNLKVLKTDDQSYVLQALAEGEDPLLGMSVQGKKPAVNRRPNSKAVSGITYIATDVDSVGRKLISMDAGNAPINDVIKKAADELGISYFLFSDIKGTSNSRVSNVTFDDFLTYLLQGTEYTHRYDQGLYLIGERKLEGLRSSKVVQFQYRSLESLQEIIPAELRKGVEIKEFRELNSMLLTGSLPQIEEIEAFLRQLDRVVPMVMIEVIMVDVRKGRSVQTGIKAGLSDSVQTGGTILPGLDFTLGAQAINQFLSDLGSYNPINIGKVTPSFYLGLSALERNSNVNIRSIPKLSTLNGHEANLSIGSTRYYSVTTQNVLGSLNPQTVVTQQFNPVQANLTINIKPVVSGDDQVTLEIEVNISDFLGETPQNQPPPSATSQFKSMIRVKNEEMIVLGGLERIERVDNGAGTPFLARIPVIKWLFSSRTKSRNKIVSVVFIKPTIIY